MKTKSVNQRTCSNPSPSSPPRYSSNHSLTPCKAVLTSSLARVFPEPDCNRHNPAGGKNWEVDVGAQTVVLMHASTTLNMDNYNDSSNVPVDNNCRRHVFSIGTKPNLLMQNKHPTWWRCAQCFQGAKIRHICNMAYVVVVEAVFLTTVFLRVERFLVRGIAQH